MFSAFPVILQEQLLVPSYWHTTPCDLQCQTERARRSSTFLSQAVLWVPILTEKRAAAGMSRWNARRCSARSLANRQYLASHNDRLAFHRVHVLQGLHLRIVPIYAAHSHGHRADDAIRGRPKLPDARRVLHTDRAPAGRSNGGQLWDEHVMVR